MKQFSDEIESVIKQIELDTISGASVLLKQACWCFISFAEEAEDESFGKFWDKLYSLARAVVSAQPDMAPLYSLSQTLLSKVKAAAVTNQSLSNLRAVIRKHATDAITHVEKIKERVIPIAHEVIEDGDILMTHSYSTTVVEVLQGLFAEGKKFQVVVSESRPGCEGIVLAEELAGEGIPVTFMVDAAAICLLCRCTKVIVGADRISEEFFTNKIGTYSLALSARERKKPFYALCDSTKFVPGLEFGCDRKNHDPDEVLAEPPENVAVSNPYFEMIPLRLVKEVVCEKGRLNPKLVAEQIQSEIEFPNLLTVR